MTCLNIYSNFQLLSFSTNSSMFFPFIHAILCNQRTRNNQIQPARRLFLNWPRRKIPWANTEKHHANFISAAANVQRAVLPSIRLTVSTAANIIQEQKFAILTRKNAIMNSSAVKSLPETTPERGFYEFNIFYHEIFSHR